MKIIYFTSTGNCLAVAKRFDAELLSIPQLEKNKEYEIKDEVVGIITPTYGFGLPEPVKRYFKKAKIDAEYVFVIATYGNISGAVLNEMKKLLEANGNHADYYETLLMVDNYLPMYEVKKQISMLDKKDIENNLQRIILEINNREKKFKNKGLGWNIISSLMNSAEDAFTKTRAKRWFSVSDKCVGCGICSKVCPVKNIIQSNKEKPIFYDKCVSCFACVHNCPQKAIHLKNERSEERFRNPKTSLKEIIDANNQM